MTLATSDEDLMLAYSAGDVSAFEALYSRHRGGLFRYLLRQTANKESAEEIFQDTWQTLIRLSERYEVKAKFSTYLYRIAHHRLIDFYRKHQRHSLLSYESGDIPQLLENTAGSASAEPEHRIDADRQVEAFRLALARLPEAQREAFVLREETGMTLHEIADTVGENAETVKSRLRYAVSKLKAAMRGTEDD